MQNMNGMQGMNIQMLGNMNGGMQNMQWQAVAGQGQQQCGGCQPCMQSMQGMTQSQQNGGNSQQMQGMQNCQAQTIFAPMQPMQNVQFIQVPTTMSLPAGMQLMPMNCQQMMVPKEWNGNNGGNFDQGQNFMVKNNFVNQEQTVPGTRCAGEKELVQQTTPEGSEEDFIHEGANSRQVSDTAMKNNGQFLIISGANSPLKAASGQSGLTMERQLQQLHLEQQQLLQQHHMQQQALAHQQQMELMYHSQQLEALKHSVNDGPQNDEIQETDDEDCIGQYPHQGPVAPTDGGMAWMTATLEGMHQCTPPQPNFAMISGPAASADTGSTPEPSVGKKKILRKKDEPQADAGSSASSAEVGMEKKKKASDPWAWEDGVVTVMVRQLPRQYTQRMLLQEVIRRGFEGLFDFLYLPYDFKKGINVGYGFVNFTEPEYALQFRDSLDGQFLDKYMRMKGKAVRVHPAQVQGYEANYRHFAHTKTGQKQDPAFSPLFFSVQSAVSSSELMKQMANAQLGRDGKTEHGNGNLVQCNAKDRSPSGLGVQEQKDKSTQNETLMPLIRLKGMPEMNAAQAMARPFGGDDETGRRKANRRNNKKSGEMLGAQGGAWVGLQGQANWMESPKGQVKVESSASSQQPFF